jgi:hypothetical protein
VPTPTPKPAPPTPTPLPTPTPFVIGGGGSGSGGGSAQGGAACSAGFGRSPSANELESDTSLLAAPGADPTSLEIQLLASAEYSRDAGANNLGFVTRLYDDVLRHDPTPVELATSISVLAGAGDARTRLVQEVVFSPEARAIRVDQAFQALLKIYPSSADLQYWVNRLSSPDAIGLSTNAMVEIIAGSAAYYKLAGGTPTSFMIHLYQDLTNVPPSQGVLAANAGLMAEIQAGSANARVAAAENVVSGAVFRLDEVTSFFANYMHPTCRALQNQECMSTIATPPDLVVQSDLTSFTTGTDEEDIIAGVLGSAQYYQNHGSTQAGLVRGAYQDLIGRAPTDAELAAALTNFTNDPVGHLNFAQGLVTSLPYQNLLVALYYQQLLLRAPVSAESISGQGILGGDQQVLQTPDELLIESLAYTSEFYADQGGTDASYVARTIATLLMHPGDATQETGFLKLPLPHDATWQTAVVQTLVNGDDYRTDFIRGVYAKFLTYSVCALATSPAADGAGFFKSVPGGWFGLGIFVGVVLIGAAAAAFFILERRRFQVTYPNEVTRHHE